MIADDCELAAYLSALANTKRLAVLRALSQGESSVGELASLVGLSQSVLSQHLAILRRQQLVETRREATSIFYSLTGIRSEKALCLINDILFPSGEQMSMFFTAVLKPNPETTAV